MSLEPGGRSDKYGNEYENRFLTRLLLQLVNETVDSIIVEPLDEFSDSVDIKITISANRVIVLINHGPSPL